MEFIYYIKYEKEYFKEPVYYHGADAVKKFIPMLKEDVIKIENFIKEKEEKYKDLESMVDFDEKHYNRTNKCHICEKEINKNDKKVIDHCHLTGKYRGPAHNNCHLNYKIPNFIPTIIHNLSGYDAHLFIKELGFDESRLEYRYVTKNLRELPNNIKEDFKKYPPKIRALKYNKYLKSVFKETAKHFPEDKLDLITRKGVYPYDYMDCEEKYEETELPPIKDFYNRLNDSNIKDDDYKHAQNVWKSFNIKNLREYSELYVKTDVLILADIFEKFRDVCLKTYKLDPAWYFTAPGLSWDAMLKKTQIKLDLIHDIDMVLMIEKGIRGGISQCCNRYAKANNKYMKEYDKNKESNYLMYLDANNLYGWTMSQYLPHGGFKWIYPNIGNILKCPDDSKKGYILEVDLEYPKELHDYHTDLPLAPEKKIPDGSKQEKLLTTLYDKTNYVVHYKILKQYLEMGLKLKKVHRILEFEQSDWLKKYIDLNTEMRKKATNEFEKDFYKLMNNSVFGKAIENVRKRIDIKFCTSYKQAKRYIAKPNFKGRTIFSENLVAIHMNKTEIKLDKPIYVGMSILDLSKHLMCDFHYNVMKPKYKDLTLLYMDTDSLTYDIKTDDFYEDMKNMINYFDTSDYQENNPYNMPRCNKKVLGIMKDENSGVLMK
ncbi:hypothetical protein AVEN_114505-1 [Araneus ventricosus]|uniref:DNA-directed DNA polymerase n=1 Tax=Araneus ventricosus TaxID=182803 RepID=A0A4Y2PKA1_ARAVE|nr:hypothetical protein AVEN_114505-1 [Araneus ventricosus]